ncbi:MAG: hypothetical protein V4671_02920 [Armatimonadota bacterium]
MRFVYSVRSRGVRLSLIGAAAILAIASAGCGEAIQNTGEDNRFIREPDIKSEAAATKKVKQGPLLPTKNGGSWRSKVTVRQIRSSSEPSIRYETTVARGLSPLAGGGGSGQLLETRGEAQKSSRREVFKVDTHGISLSSISGEQSLAAIPPFPIVRYPIQEGHSIRWNGILRLADKSYPGQGYSRIRSPEEISLPQGKVTAYRVDTVLIVNDGGRQVSIPMARWFAPGIGMVRQRFIVGNSDVTKDTISYKL